MPSSINGRLWINKSEHNFLGEGRMELLMHIDRDGSITKAAKSMKMSYKAAWDAVDAMNNLSEFPLVTSAKGGKGGGGTHLSDYAKELINTYKILQEEHQQFLNNLSKRISEKNGHIHLLKSMDIRISARNQLRTKVVEIQKGALKSRVSLELNNKDTITAIITNDSLSTLEITIGTELYALFKANALTLSDDSSPAKGDINRFAGEIIRIERGKLNAEIILELKGGNTVCSTLPIEMLERLNLKNKMHLSAFCEPKNIILGRW
ncbi:TOBE domain-containing protein [Sulfurimonas sp.]|jgi:molybdate transport system regulatory protein|uniref:TOBE domain-containing protein n=1 Tax=Sulfurimonas sp. TaxID=2022749 RepID=UPI0025DD6F9C|nr:TOBE domain-containing protein [Sulfurimonas sp.]MCK9473386.1 TOBE domain-containing protein [Sulfurimonas sp.]MDD3506251.1 TOBE domain-containing protein [Sulfurimonas sp.]